MGLTLRLSFSVRLSALLRDQESDAAIMNLTIDCEQGVDGRWIAEVPQLSGVTCHVNSADDAIAEAEVLALRTMAERLEANESRPVEFSISFPLAA